MKYSITLVKYNFSLMILYKIISDVHIFDAD